MPVIKEKSNGIKYQNPDLFSILGLYMRDRIAIIGCGGKTSLMYALAAGNPDKSVLVTTTTRILRPPAHVCDFEINGKIKAVEKGVYLYVGGEKDGKLFSPPENGLARIQSLFDCVIIEADGSKMRPLKGWADYEPVVPDFATATVAVAAVSPIGEAISEKNTHRLSDFCEIAGAAEGEAVTAAHIAAMISHPRGMLQKAVGKRVLFINQVKSEDDRTHAFAVLNCLPTALLKSLSRVIIGNLERNTFEIIWEAKG